MIIWGWRRTVRRVATVRVFCPVCNGTYATALNRLVKMFTLFFIPLFPLSTRHSLTCTSCGTVQMINSTMAQQVQQQAYQELPPGQQQMQNQQTALPPAQQQIQNPYPAPPPGYPQQIQNHHPALAPGYPQRIQNQPPTPPPGYPQQNQRPPRY